MSIAIRLLRDWSGIIFVASLIIGLLGESSEYSPRTLVFLGIAALTYVLCWQNFARLADASNGLSYRWGLAIAAVGIAAPFLAVVESSIVGRTGWVLLGLAMLVVARAILKGASLPDGFGWISGIFGIVMILVGVTRDGSNISAGPLFTTIGWTITMSALYIGWGHFEDHKPDQQLRQ